jgi:hypothetical protein
MQVCKGLDAEISDKEALMSQLQRATEQNLATHQKYSTRIHTMEQELAEAMRQKAEVSIHSSNPKSDISFWNLF